MAIKELTIYKAPEILILHLKRFKNRGVYRKEKNEANIEFPHDLDIRKYVVDPHPISSYIPYAQEKGLFKTPSYEMRINPNSEPLYELYAVSNHSGSLGGGHYTAYAKNNGKWYSFNDSSVHAVSASSVTNSMSTAYMLFYRRKGQSP